MDSQKITYPIYIISKGRWENPLTAKFLLKEGIPFTIAVEPQEYENYCSTIPREYVAKLPFSDLGLWSFPARNWCWEDSIAKGFERHFLLDDNIYGFSKYAGKKREQGDFAREAFITLEKITNMYKNIAISGWEYHGFTIEKSIKKPFKYNCHVYSAMLIRNDLPFRWRLKYNEDVDLCLNALDRGYNTLSLYYYCTRKVSTVMKMKGGNQTELYQGNAHDKKVLKAKSLETVWPQYVKTVMRFNRPHHQVNWKQHFKHTLVRSETNDGK